MLVYLGNSNRKGKRVLEYLIETTQIFAAEVVKKEEQNRTNIAQRAPKRGAIIQK